MRKKKKIILSTLAGASLAVGAVAYISPTIESNGISFVNYKTIVDSENETWLTFNSKFKNSKGEQSPQYKEYGSSKKFWKEVYKGGYTWYSISPPSVQDPSLDSQFMGYMLENKQKVVGKTGSKLVTGAEIKTKAYRYNLKFGSSDPYTMAYNGKNSGTKTIETGSFKGKNYEWRFLGYDMGGAAIGNPWFPNDITSSAYNGKTRSQVATIFAKKDWIPKSWKESYSQNLFGTSAYNSSTSEKEEWIEDYLFSDYPELEKKGGKSYWANILMPMTDPSKGTGVWVGWHQLSNGKRHYKTFVTTGPAEPNLRLMEFSIYDGDKLLATETRSDNRDTIQEDGKEKITKGAKLSKGTEYRVVVKVKNMPGSKKISNTPISLDTMYSYDDKIGHATSYSKENLSAEKANAPYDDALSVGKTATFEYTYTVPSSAKPEEKVQMFSRIPIKFYTRGLNVNTLDDKSSITFKVAPENLAVKFDGYYDQDKKKTDLVDTSSLMYARYTVTKKAGTKKVVDPTLTINVNDSKTVAIKTTMKNNGVTLKKVGDKTSFYAPISPKYPKVCSDAVIPGSWASDGLNASPSDDTAKGKCIQNPNNIIVSNVVAKPKTITIPSNKSKASVATTVTYNLRNYTYDKNTKKIPVIVTIDGVIKSTEEVSVATGKKIEHTVTLPKTDLTVGKHTVQVEANPAPRKYIEFHKDRPNPYSDNIGHYVLTVVKSPPIPKCDFVNTSNTWNTNFRFSEWNGYWGTEYYTYWDAEDEIYRIGSYSVQRTSWNYWNENESFYENHEIKSIYFRSKLSNDKQGGWVDLLKTNGKIKAGYGFELKVVTTYETNTYQDTPRGWDNGWTNGVNVSPTYTEVDSTHNVAISMPFKDIDGNPIEQVLTNMSTSGSWYNKTRSFELNEREVISKPERKIYISEATKNGTYQIKVNTGAFSGSADKSFSKALCDVETVKIEVIGSYLEDLNTHITQ